MDSAASDNVVGGDWLKAGELIADGTRGVVTGFVRWVRDGSQ